MRQRKPSRFAGLPFVRVKKPLSPLPRPLPLLTPKVAEPRDILGELFDRVQRERLFGDSKTFVDLIPAKRLRQIKMEYDIAAADPDFNLQEFVSRHFYEFANTKDQYKSDPSQSIVEHIDKLWPVLTRRTNKTTGTLLALPHPYVVPGGRFNEQFYWDSYFIMLGLAEAGKWQLIEGMVDNFVYMLGKYGIIPSGNRTYFLSRSQPPFLSHMVRLLASHYGKMVYAHYLPALIGEYNFWMRGRTRIFRDDRPARRRVVKLRGGELANRYFSGHSDPRPESFVEDVDTARSAPTADEWTFVELRAGAESGWDFSSRWLADPTDLASIQITDLVPVDLNCLLFELESLIATIYGKLRQKTLSDKYQAAAQSRAGMINRYCWSAHDGFYYDYDFVRHQRTGRATVAAAFALMSGVASPAQAQQVARRLESDFLCLGGLRTTLVESGQQWDAPNGWAPLQYVAIRGLRRYGFDDLANEIKRRWIAVNLAEYQRSGKLVEKYNVAQPDHLGGGGEYPLQDGFGWTNGVLRTLLAEK